MTALVVANIAINLVMLGFNLAMLLEARRSRSQRAAEESRAEALRSIAIRHALKGAPNV